MQYDCNTIKAATGRQSTKLVTERLRTLGSIPELSMHVASLGNTINAPGPRSLPVVVDQPDKKLAD